MKVEEFYLAITIVACLVFTYIGVNHVRNHERSDSEIMDRLTKNKKAKK